MPPWPDADIGMTMLPPDAECVSLLIHQRLGFELTTVPDAPVLRIRRTYSITQSELAQKLHDNKLGALESGNPDISATANIGCQVHLDDAGRTPVRHWIERPDAPLP